MKRRRESAIDKVTIQVGRLRIEIEPEIVRIIVTPSLGKPLTMTRNQFEEGIRLHLKQIEVDR